MNPIESSSLESWEMKLLNSFGMSILQSWDIKKIYGQEKKHKMWKSEKNIEVRNLKLKCLRCKIHQHHQRNWFSEVSKIQSFPNPQLHHPRDSWEILPQDTAIVPEKNTAQQYIYICLLWGDPAIYIYIRKFTPAIEKYCLKNTP